MGHSGDAVVVAVLVQYGRARRLSGGGDHQVDRFRPAMVSRLGQQSRHLNGTVHHGWIDRCVSSTGARSRATRLIELVEFDCTFLAESGHVSQGRGTIDELPQGDLDRCLDGVGARRSSSSAEEVVVDFYKALRHQDRIADCLSRYTSRHGFDWRCWLVGPGRKTRRSSRRRRLSELGQRRESGSPQCVGYPDRRRVHRRLPWTSLRAIPRS